MQQITPSTEKENSAQTSVVVTIDGQQITLTREQEALIRAWAAGPV